MRSFHLARIAAQAEVLYLRCLVQRQGLRVILAAAATVFLLAFLAVLHVAAVFELSVYVTPIQAMLLVAGVDMLIGVVLALFAARDRPSRLEQEALAVRETAGQQLAQAARLTSLAAPLLRMIGTRKAYGIAPAALTARYLSGRR